jgi:hypothetical protein
MCYVTMIKDDYVDPLADRKNGKGMKEEYTAV